MSFQIQNKHYDATNNKGSLTLLDPSGLSVNAQFPCYPKPLQPGQQAGSTIDDALMQAPKSR